MHSYSSPGVGPSPYEPTADAPDWNTDEQENKPNGNRPAQQSATHKSAAAVSRVSPSHEEIPLSPFPPMSHEEDSGRGESRNDFPERGGEAYDDASRGPPPGLLPRPPVSRAHSLTSHSSSAADSTSVASSLSEYDPSKVYVENLPLPISETQLRDLFQQFGAITRIHIGTDRITKAQLGFGFVEFAQDHQGLNAIATMHQREINGRIIRCSQAKRRASPNTPLPASSIARSNQQSLLGASGNAASPAMMGSSVPLDLSGMQQPQHPFMMLNPAMMGGMAMMPQQMAGTAGMMVQTPMGMMQPMIMMMPAAAPAPAAPAAAAAAAQPPYGRNDAPPSPNIFINGIPFAYTETDLQSLFEAFGTVVSTKILMDPQGKSKGQGFVHFEKQASAQASIQAWNGKKPPNGETYLQVRYALPRKTGPAAGAVAPVAPAVVQQQPQQQFAPSQVMSGSTSPSGTGGQLPFAPSRVAGALGVGAGNDSGYGPDRKGRAHLGQKHDPLSRPAPSTASTGASNLSSVYGAPAVAVGAASLVANGPDSTTLFIYHVPKNLTNDELQALFSQHGGVISVSIPRDSNNENKGFAFAKMQTMADAHNAMNALQGHEIQGKRLKVSFKTERRADTGVVLPPGSAANTALQPQQQPQAAQPQLMMINPMGGMGMMFNPMMMAGGGGMTPQQQQQLQMMQPQMMQPMPQMSPMQQGAGAGGMQQMAMMQPMQGSYGMQAGGMMQPGAGQPGAQGQMGGYGQMQQTQPQMYPQMQPQQPQYGFPQQPYQQ